MNGERAGARPEGYDHYQERILEALWSIHTLLDERLPKDRQAAGGRREEEEAAPPAEAGTAGR